MSGRHVSELGFVVIVAFAAWSQLRAVRADRRGLERAARPVRFGEAITSAMTSTLGRIAVLGWWWWLGWHFLAR